MKLVAPTPIQEKIVTVKEALTGLPNVIPNSNKEAEAYTNEESAYSIKMQDLNFWKREEFNNDLTYQKPMRHRNSTIERFKLINQGESLKIYLKDIQVRSESYYRSNVYCLKNVY